MTGRRRDEGSISAELAVLLPVFAALVVLAIVQGRALLGQAAVEHAAYDAARTASLARDADTAGDSATAAATSSLAAQGLGCTSVTVTVDTSGFSLPGGTPASVRATVACTISYGNLNAIPGVPPSRTLTATFVSPLDQYRGRT